jgi:hypothetical protein
MPDNDTRRRIEAHLVGIERQLDVNEAYVKSSGGDVAMAEIGNSHVRDAITEIRRELSGARTYPEPHLMNK